MSLLDSPDYVPAMFATYFPRPAGASPAAGRRGVAPRDAMPFATLESPPLFDVVRDVNKLSNNVMARQVFLTLATAKAPPPATTAGARPRRAGAGSREHRLKMPELVLDNGSGLSRRERITAGSLVTPAARRRCEQRARRVRELARGRGDGRHGAAALPERHRRRAGAAEDRHARRRARDRGLRDRRRDGRRFALAALVNHPNAGHAQAALDFLVQWVYQNGATWTGEPAR